MADPGDTGSTEASRFQTDIPEDRTLSRSEPLVNTRESVVSLEKEEHGGIKWGSAFFGWLTATAMTVLLTALTVAVGTALGVATDTEISAATDQATSQMDTLGLVGGIIALVILLVAYYCGGYVAGRMARFDGLKQGLAVWLWAIVISVVTAAVGVVAGSQYNVFDQLDSSPGWLFGDGVPTTSGLIAIAAVIVTTLVGALLGGLAGMRFHRNVDKTGLGH